MFHTVVTADLPSEEQAGNAPQDPAWVGAHDRVSFHGSRLLALLQQVFAHVGITDATYVLLDGEVIYADSNETDDADLDQLLVRANDEGFLDKGFHELRLGLAYWDEGIQHVLEARVLTSVPVGEHELTVRIDSRPDDLNARRLDTPKRYRARLHEIAANDGAVRRWKESVDAVAAKVAGSLKRSLFRQEVHLGRAMFRVVRPTDPALRGIEGLPWGDDVLPVRYQLHPQLHVSDGWDDPFRDVYEDAYLAFRHWLFLDAILGDERLRYEWVEVVEPSGARLFQGHKAGWFAAWPWGKRRSHELFDDRVAVSILAAG